MKFLLLLLLCVPVFGQSFEDRVKQFEKPRDYTLTFDKFEKETKIDWHSYIRGPRKKGFVSGNETLELIASVHIPQSGDTWYSLLFIPSIHTIYDHDDRLRFLVDGVNLDIHDRPSIDDVAGFIVTKDEWLKLISGKTVEMQLRSFEGTLDEKTLTAFRNLASLTKPSDH